MSEVAELKKYPKFHIIDPDTEGEEFSAEKLGVWFEGADLLARGMDFGVVSVLGCQSSGKSTLLNLLFATEFDTMEVFCFLICFLFLFLFLFGMIVPIGSWALFVFSFWDSLILLLCS